MEHRSPEERRHGHHRSPETNGNGGWQLGVDRQYLGHYESVEAYAAQFAEENGLLDRIEPAWLKAWLRLDLETLGRDLTHGLIVIKDPKGGIQVYEPGDEPPR